MYLSTLGTFIPLNTLFIRMLAKGITDPLFIYSSVHFETDNTKNCDFTAAVTDNNGIMGK
jgi:hypothetical protein